MSHHLNQSKEAPDFGRAVAAERYADDNSTHDLFTHGIDFPAWVIYLSRHGRTDRPIRTPDQAGPRRLDIPFDVEAERA